MIYQNGKDFNLEILRDNIKSIETYTISNFKVIVYSYELLEKIDSNTEIINKLIPKKYINNTLLYIMSNLTSNNIVIMDSSKLITFNIDLLFKDYNLVYLELEKKLDLIDLEYDRKYWMIKNMLLKLGFNTDIILINLEFFFYKNSQQIINMTEYLIKNKIFNDNWLIINIVLLIHCNNKINLYGEKYYLFDNNNKLLGNAILNKATPILVNFFDTYNKKVKLIKSNSNLKIQNNQSIYYNIDIKDEKIYEYI